jgi:heme exporter protein A
VLHVRNLTFGYRAVPVFSDVNFTVNPGELLHLRGDNGAGKTSLLRVLAGLLEADRGEISWSDNTAREYLSAEQNSHWLELDGLTNLRFWLNLRGANVEPQRLRSELDSWRMPAMPLDTKLAVKNYSTGMKRKLALARVVLSDARVWLLDEPVSGLDESSVRTFSSKLQAHLASKGSCIIVSHETGFLQPIKHKTLQL